LNVHKDLTRKFYPGTGAMLIKNGIIKNYFDSEYFFYQEDIYLGWLLRIKGYNVNRSPKSVVHVLGSKSISSKEIRKKFQFYGERNRMINFLTFYETKNVIKLFPLYISSMLFRVLLNLYKNNWKSLAYIKSYTWVLLNLEKISKKRSVIQKQRKVSDSEIISEMTSKLLNGNGSISRLVNSMSHKYCKIFGIKTLEG